MFGQIDLSEHCRPKPEKVVSDQTLHCLLLIQLFEVCVPHINHVTSVQMSAIKDTSTRSEIDLLRYM